MKNEIGITLVALIITIIILLILAGISISSLTNNGLFGKTEEADRKTEIAGIKEKIQLDIYAKQLQNLGTITDKELVGILKEYGTVNYEEYVIKGITTKKGYEIPISEIYIEEIAHKTTLECAEGAKPEGSTIIETDETKGIVMVDSKGNEWTWVEVPKTTVFTTAQNATDYDNIKTDLINYAKDYREGSEGQGFYWTDEWYDSRCGVSNSTTYIQMYNKMLSSVYTNGGFWISRYEIGDATATTSNITRTSSSGTSGIPVSKRDQIPYNYVECNQAQILSSGMSTDTNKTSSLLFGIQWDLTCKFLEEKTDLEKTDIKSNSTSWGNYKDSSLTLNRGKYNPTPSASGTWTQYTTDTENYVTNQQTSSNTSYYQLLTTGASEKTNKMNIYDFAGNEYEYTLEHATSNLSSPCVYRGGSCYNAGSITPASIRSDTTKASMSGTLGFRATLY